MKSFREFSKNKWKLVVHENDKDSWGKELINLVNNAYQHTTLGSFVNSIADVKNSEWVVMDWDKDPEVDCAVFFRKSRSNETWDGYKLQGIGHDGQAESKKKLLDRISTHLNKEGFWIECSDAMASALAKRNVPAVTDESFAQKLFPNTNLKMSKDGHYERMAGDGKVKEIIYGKPKLKSGLKEDFLPEGPLSPIPKTKSPNRFHGNYGGYGNRGGEPKDHLDHVFQKHDVGYHHTPDKKKRLKHDKALVKQTDSISSDKNHPVKLRIKAKMASLLFKTKLKLHGH